MQKLLAVIASAVLVLVPTPAFADEGDNRHPSGKDRSYERNEQGNSNSTPDQNGKGPERDHEGIDKPGGPGGVDKDDQDGNNGCGNDDDFEDDNEGNCGGKPTDKPTDEPTDKPRPSDKPSPSVTPTPGATPSPGVTLVPPQVIDRGELPRTGTDPSRALAIAVAALVTGGALLKRVDTTGAV